jgi:hypothetical protein
MSQVGSGLARPIQRLRAVAGLDRPQSRGLAAARAAGSRFSRLVVDDQHPLMMRTTLQELLGGFAAKVPGRSVFPGSLATRREAAFAIAGHRIGGDGDDRYVLQRRKARSRRATS